VVAPGAQIIAKSDGSFHYEPPKAVTFPPDLQKFIEAFQRFYYEPLWKMARDQGAPLPMVRWLGNPCQKWMFDLFVIQEIIYDTRPDIIIECGTSTGGSALFMASICELLHHGEVITVDIEQFSRSLHPGVTWVVSDVLDPELLEGFRDWSTMSGKVMVVLDDDHTKDHVLREMEVYGEFVTPGCYMVVEDTNINGHPVFDNFGPGPWEAVQEYLPQHPEYVVDKSREHLLLTHNPSGYLLKVRG
jgi:cephalosporin hydroxylase